MIKYTNNWQHLLMSIFTMFIGVFFYFKGVPGVGVGLVSLVATTWFVPGVVKQFASQVTKELEEWILTTYGRRPYNQEPHPLQILEQEKRVSQALELQNEKGEELK